jgi:hypothetical protein
MHVFIHVLCRLARSRNIMKFKEKSSLQGMVLQGMVLQGAPQAVERT